MTGLLSQEISDYLAVRRSLGYQMARPGKLLPQLAAYLERAGAVTVTTEHALAWAVLPGRSQSWHAYRLAVARRFASWLATVDPAAEIPPAGLIPARPGRATPYLYTDEEVTALMAAAESLRSPLRTATYRTLVGIPAATGMRIGEAIGLDRGDVNLVNEILTIRSGKNGKSRLVPLHPTTAQAIGGYLRDRNRLCPGPGRSQARLARQRHASGQTVAAHRDAWRLLLAFAAGRTSKQPSALGIADLGAPLIGSFLDHLEQKRGNGARTRNARLAAIRSMFAYAALRHPEHAETIARVLAIPAKKFDRALVTWLTEPEVDALLTAPDKATWAGRRDHAMLTGWSRTRWSQPAWRNRR